MTKVTKNPDLLGNKGYPGMWTFSAKTKEILGKHGQLVTLALRPRPGTITRVKPDTLIG